MIFDLPSIYDLFFNINNAMASGERKRHSTRIAQNYGARKDS